MLVEEGVRRALHGNAGSIGGGRTGVNWHAVCSVPRTTADGVFRPEPGAAAFGLLVRRDQLADAAIVDERRQVQFDVQRGGRWLQNRSAAPRSRSPHARTTVPPPMRPCTRRVRFMSAVRTAIGNVLSAPDHRAFRCQWVAIRRARVACRRRRRPVAAAVRMTRVGRVPSTVDLVTMSGPRWRTRSAPVSAVGRPGRCHRSGACDCFSWCGPMPADYAEHMTATFLDLRRCRTSACPPLAVAGR